MTKSVLDLANLMDILVDPTKTCIPQGGYKTALTATWADLKIGVLNLADWGTSDSGTEPNPGATKQMVRRYFYRILARSPTDQTDRKVERSLRECVFYH